MSADLVDRARHQARLRAGGALGDLFAELADRIAELEGSGPPITPRLECIPSEGIARWREESKAIRGLSLCDPSAQAGDALVARVEELEDKLALANEVIDALKLMLRGMHRAAGGESPFREAKTTPLYPMSESDRQVAKELEGRAAGGSTDA